MYSNYLSIVKVQVKVSSNESELGPLEQRAELHARFTPRTPFKTQMRTFKGEFRCAPAQHRLFAAWSHSRQGVCLNLRLADLPSELLTQLFEPLFVSVFPDVCGI